MSDISVDPLAAYSDQPPHVYDAYAEPDQQMPFGDDEVPLLTPIELPSVRRPWRHACSPGSLLWDLLADARFLWFALLRFDSKLHLTRSRSSWPTRYSSA